MDNAIELDDLLAAITEEIKHQETDWGEAQGEERWRKRSRWSKRRNTGNPARSQHKRSPVATWLQGVLQWMSYRPINLFDGSMVSAI
jgi:hypothetical protein